jgi:hypothetical protein
MYQKACLLCFVLLIPCIAYSQDEIYKTDGSIIKAVITNADDSTITYKNDFKTGPDYIILKSKVDKVVYYNSVGTNDDVYHIETKNIRYISGGKAGDVIEHTRLKYGPDVIAGAPIQLSDNGIGLGASFEHFFDKSQVLCLWVPIYYTEEIQLFGGPSSTMTYLAPGLKIYPTGNQGVVRAAIASSLLIAYGTHADNYNYNYNNYSSGQQAFMLGALITASLNINPTPHFYIGVDFGLGQTILNKLGRSIQNNQTVGEFAIRFGGRFNSNAQY